MRRPASSMRPKGLTVMWISCCRTSHPKRSSIPKVTSKSLPRHSEVSITRTGWTTGCFQRTEPAKNCRTSFRSHRSRDTVSTHCPVQSLRPVRCSITLNLPNTVRPSISHRSRVSMKINLSGSTNFRSATSNCSLRTADRKAVRSPRCLTGRPPRWAAACCGGGFHCR